MKTSVYKLIILVAVFIYCNGVDAKKREEVEKSKVIEKSYNVNAQHELDITNKFGRVHINTWEKNEISVKIDMIARGRNEERARDLLDNINVNINDSGTLLKFETKLEGSLNSRKSESFEINYLVSMPERNALKLKNSFGDSYLGNFSGNLDLDISYGDVKVKNLTGDSRVKISFGEGEIDIMEKGDLTVKYSDVEVEKLGNVELDFGYSDVNVEKAGKINLTLKYGDLEIEELESAEGYIGFSDFKIDELFSSLDLETSYSGGFKVDKVSKDFKKIELEGKFGSFRLGFEEGTNAEFETKLKFCDFNYSDLDVELTYKVKGDTKSEYKGKIGNGAGGTISITSGYGDVKFFKR